MASLTKRKRRGRVEWFVLWKDHFTAGSGKSKQVWTNCATGDHTLALQRSSLAEAIRRQLVHGATNSAQRKALLAAYEEMEAGQKELLVTVGGSGPLFDTPVVRLIEQFLALLDHRVDGAHLDREFDWRPSAINRPLKASSRVPLKATIDAFRSWMVETVPDLRTGDLEGKHIDQFLDSRQSEKEITPRTRNRYRAEIRSMFYALKRKQCRRLFRIDPEEIFRDEVESIPEPRRDIRVYTPEDIAEFLSNAEKVALDSPVIPLALLTACTGLRLSEALSLRWNDCHLPTGVISVDASKTGRIRKVPLVGDRNGDIAPTFLELLRAWRRAHPGATFVLPENGRDGAPANPRKAWSEVLKGSKLESFGCQTLRATFESGLAAIGYPHTVSALILGHTPEVAERHYLNFILGAKDGDSLEAAIGVLPFVTRELRRAQSLTESVMDLEDGRTSRSGKQTG